MTEKRFVCYEHKGAEYILENPNTHLDFIEMLGDCLDEKEIVNRLNELYDENEQLKQFPIKLDDRIQKLKEDLEKLTEMDKSDLNPQAVEDVATVIGISLNALIEFRKELDGDVE